MKMDKIKLFTCVYCLQNKPVEDFNKEHVAPKSFGTYQNSMTLYKNQVCKQCNDVFSKQLESEIAEDSFEALLRLTNGTKELSFGHKLKDTRMKLKGQDGALKGLDFRVIADSTAEEKIQLIPEPAIGIKISESPVEYQYYRPDNFPCYSTDIAKQISDKTNPILYWSMAENEVVMLLKNKGYPSVKSHEKRAFTELYDGEMLNLRIDLIMDKILNRLVAKVAFNYLIYTEGCEYALLPKFNPVRNFIRFGTDDHSVVVKHRYGKTFKDKNGSHIIALVWGDQRQKGIYGLVSWFNEITHIICLTSSSENIIHPLPVSVFDNESKKIHTSRISFSYSDLWGVRG